MDLLKLQSDGIHPSAFITMVALIVGVIVLVAILACYWSKVRLAEQDANLKIEMLQRGFGAEDIERVLNARRLDDNAFFKDRLVNRGLSSAEIAKILEVG